MLLAHNKLYRLIVQFRQDVSSVFSSTGSKDSRLAAADQTPAVYFMETPNRFTREVGSTGLMSSSSILAALLLALLFSLSPIATAEDTNASTDVGETSTAIESEVQAKTNEEMAERRKNVLQDAVAAITQSKEALQALDENRIDDALENLAIATGKLELIVARDPRLALAPTDVTVKTYDIYGSPAAIRASIAAAEDALEDGDVQMARRMLSGLRSETVITVANLPLGTYPDAIKAIAPLIDEGKVEEAKRGLQAALNTLVLTDQIVPLPVLRTEENLKQAEELAEKEERSDEENEKLASQLGAARQYLEIADLLGYGHPTDYDSLYEQLDAIEEKTYDGKSGRGFFDNITEKVRSLLSAKTS